MTTIDDLNAMQTPEQDPIAAAEQLAAMLDLPSVGLAIRGARIVGRGSRASADLYLSDGSEITFETLRDFANPTRLTLEIVACTGARPALKLPQAMAAVALLRVIAEHQETMTTDQLSNEWGTSYLQSVATRAVDMNDQAARWEAFCALERIDPVAMAHREGISVATASLVLVHTDGTRLVRCKWFRAYAKSEDASVSPQEIAHRMQRVGWHRRGTEGKVKATRPGIQGSPLIWSFYSVPKGWEER